MVVAVVGVGIEAGVGVRLPVHVALSAWLTGPGGRRAAQETEKIGFRETHGMMPVAVRSEAETAYLGC